MLHRHTANSIEYILWGVFYPSSCKFEIRAVIQVLSMYVQDTGSDTGIRHAGSSYSKYRSIIATLVRSPHSLA